MPLQARSLVGGVVLDVGAIAVPETQVAVVGAVTLEQVPVGVVGTKVGVALNAGVVVQEGQGTLEEMNLLVFATPALEL